MAHSSASGAVRFHSRGADMREAATDRTDGALGQDARIARPAFATRAQARLLDVLGWKIAESPRREERRHAPLQCCFVLRDGAREEAAFGYTGLTAPHETDDAGLLAARVRVERFLSMLGEDRGLLLQNEPLLAFGRGGDRVAIFGGWRFVKGRWTPFLLGPDGLGGVTAQEVLFESGTGPQDMAEICGCAADTALPGLAGLIGEIRALEAGQDTGRGAEDSAVLRFRPHGSGWFRARLDPPPSRAGSTPLLLPIPRWRGAEAGESGAATPAADLPGGAGDHKVPYGVAWDTGSDEFRFHGAGEVRK